MSYTKDEVIVPRNVEDEMKDSYLRYSMSVIISRALPDARDGLKPSQRRILYAMKQLNLGLRASTENVRQDFRRYFRRVPSSCEMVIYPTLVRMAQKWIMRYQLIDGQGNLVLSMAILRCYALYRSAFDHCSCSVDGMTRIKTPLIWSLTMMRPKKNRLFFRLNFPTFLQRLFRDRCWNGH